MIASFTFFQLIQLLGILSAVTFVGTLFVVPWLILQMKPEYFIRHRMKVVERHRRHPVLAVLAFFLRNGFGLGLLAAGIAMLVLPGQGILTILVGLSLMDFPGKHRLLEKVVENEKVQQSLNWIRRKGNKEALVFKMEHMEG